MLERLISRYINRQIDLGILKQEEREAYEYGYFIIALEILNISVMAVIGILFRCFLPLLFFTLCLILLRKYAGGAHASGYVRCAAASAVLELAVALMLRSQLWQVLFLPMIPLALCGCVIIWVYSPVAAVSKPLSEPETVQFRKKAHGRLLLEAAAAMLLFFMKNDLLFFIVMINFVTVAAAMGIGLWQNHKA